jgi:magnesium chelatase subunit D
MADAPALPGGDPAWDRVTLVLSVLAVDPAGLGGLWLRARVGPARDAVVAALPVLPLPQKRLHPGLTDEALFGGLDLTATLAAGRPVRSEGLLAQPSALILTMAERCPAGMAARLAQALDQPRHCLVALDEAAEAGEGLPGTLADRLGLFLSLDGLAVGSLALDAGRIAAARLGLAGVRLPANARETLARVALALGIDSLRAVLFALRAARAVAALRGHKGMRAEDVTTAAELVFAHRATRVPETADPTPPEPPPAEGESLHQEGMTPPDDLMVEAVRAMLPPDLLDHLDAARAARALRGATGAGEAKVGNRRGRPLPARPGHPSAEKRLDLVATLRAAVPWQALRRVGVPERLIHLRPSDLRVKRSEERSDRVLVFAVDASGSSAMARFGEAKGAVELLLGRAYARRDHVALVVFRGASAELVLPPTRSLVQVKRRLAGVPGGGGTPLAGALQLAEATALRARGRGLSPVVALLTDGRANVALDGTPGRARAEAEAAQAARSLRGLGLPGVVIDTAARPQDGLRLLAASMGAVYLALPRADAQRLSVALEAALA